MKRGEIFATQMLKWRGFFDGGIENTEMAGGFCGVRWRRWHELNDEGHNQTKMEQPKNYVEQVELRGFLAKSAARPDLKTIPVRSQMLFEIFELVST